ncbi:hypothetical protein JOC34_001847 [Virgibacillus halotolerans]|uniref:hypothetical protein n=1 Tax=Virgibacillus halotolerans TaxID=1071053 RepID=UPI0019617701|nr:hypothetical protein [Virgibacillus halotolerans]MBM7599479.1 hypothetical protein [Virgibacillus halotolerans]
MTIKDMKSNKFYGVGSYVLTYENKFGEQEIHRLYVENEKEFTETLIDTRLSNNNIEMFTTGYPE